MGGGFRRGAWGETDELARRGEASGITLKNRVKSRAVPFRPDLRETSPLLPLYLPIVGNSRESAGSGHPRGTVVRLKYSAAVGRAKVGLGVSLLLGE